MDRSFAWAAIPARVLLAVLFLASGVMKLTLSGAMQQYMTAYGVPAILLWPAAAWELVAGALLILGLWARPVALLLAGWCLLTAAIFHRDVADLNQLTNLLKNITMAGAFLLFAAYGLPGWRLGAPPHRLEN